MGSYDCQVKVILMEGITTKLKTFCSLASLLESKLVNVFFAF